MESDNANTLNTEVTVGIPRGLSGTASSFLEAGRRLYSLYRAQVAGSLTLPEEREQWAGITDILGRAGESLDAGAAGRAELEGHLSRLKNGIYDLYPVGVTGEDGGRAELILGKVFPGEGGGESLYAGAACVCNDTYTETIKSADKNIGLLRKEMLPPGSPDGDAGASGLPVMRCADVFSLSGALDGPHKPICVFYSGGVRENLSSLSNLTVFINLYTARFRTLTSAIAQKYLSGSGAVAGLSEAESARLLLVWLRGHDSGHFIGTDSLSESMSELDPDYMCLHELKSDMIALRSIAFHGDGMKETAYLAAVAEMMRYIRRPGIHLHADSASAYLAFRYFLDRGAVGYDAEGKKFEIDARAFEEAASDYADELLRLFASGDAGKARMAARRWGNTEAGAGRAPEGCPAYLARVITDTELPRYINYDFRLK